MIREGRYSISHSSVAAHVLTRTIILEVRKTMRAHGPRIKTRGLNAFKANKRKEAEDEAFRLVIPKDQTEVMVRALCCSPT